MSKQFYRRCLPHWQIPEATYFVTYRLAGSIPMAVVRQMQAQYLQEVEAARKEAYELAEVPRDSVPGVVSADAERGFAEQSSATHVPRDSVPGVASANVERGFAERSSATLRRAVATHLKNKRYEAYKRQFKRWDDFLDAHILNEPHWLKQEPLAQLNMDAIRFYDGKRYRLLACCIMANHIHLLLHLLPGAPELSKVMRDLKKYTAVHGNRLLGREGVFGKQRVTTILSETTSLSVFWRMCSITR